MPKPCWEPAGNEGSTMTEPTDIDNDIGVTSRRRFLRKGGALVGGAVIAGGLAGSEALEAGERTHNLPPNVPEWMKAPGDPMGSQLYGTPSPFEKGVIKKIPKDLSQYLSASGRTPLQDLDGIITPNGLFYERHHAGVPTIDPAQHRLMLHGLVDKPLIFTMDDIRRFPSESRIHFLECSGNPEYKKPYGKTASDLVGLLSCAEWTGVSLKLVLQQAGLQPGAKWVVAEGADAAAMTRSIPIEKCLDDAMLQDSQNGERLRPQQAQLQDPVLTRALTRFRLPWHWDSQPAVIQSRATDETGYVQPTLAELLAVRGDNYTYHNNAIWPWRIATDGEVTNANA